MRKAIHNSTFYHFAWQGCLAGASPAIIFQFVWMGELQEQGDAVKPGGVGFAWPGWVLGQRVVEGTHTWIEVGVVVDPGVADGAA